MFTILHKSVGGRVFDRYFESWDNAKELMDKEVESFSKNGLRITRKFDYFNVAKGFYVYQVLGVTEQNEEVIYALIDGYFQDDILEDKISHVLDGKFNLFHSALINRALWWGHISYEDFVKGYDEIVKSERDTDDDEFVPDVFKDV